MKRNVIIIIAAATLLAASGQYAAAQTGETKKLEVGVHFSSLSLDEGFETRTEPGFGGRLTYNLNDHVALEAEGNFFPRSDTLNAFRNGGRAAEGLFGLKAGRRFNRFGIFAKARPGFISFSQGRTDFSLTGDTTNPFSAVEARVSRLTHFAADVGGVLEIYHTRRIFTRFDAGDTIIRYGRTTINTFSLTPGGTLVQTPFTVPGDTVHNFQFSAGVGFRF